MLSCVAECDAAVAQRADSRTPAIDEPHDATTPARVVFADRRLKRILCWAAELQEGAS